MPFDDRLVAERRARGTGMDLTAAEIARSDGRCRHRRLAPRPSPLVHDRHARRWSRPRASSPSQAARDGHDFVGDAFAHGASVAVVREPAAEPVPDAARRADRGHGGCRHRSDAWRAPGCAAATRVVGITGSAGKTATKDLTAAALAPARRVHASPVSFNNEAGLAADPARRSGGHGGRRRRDGRALHRPTSPRSCDIARPDVGVVTHVGMAHAEFLGGRSGIVDVKAELRRGAAVERRGGAERRRRRDARAGARARTRGCCASAVPPTPTSSSRTSGSTTTSGPRSACARRGGPPTCALELRGEHQATNAAMAAAVAAELGVPLADAATGLADARPAPHRMDRGPQRGRRHRAQRRLQLEPDVRPRPRSDRSPACRSRGRRIAVLGEMRELGEHADERARGGRARLRPSPVSTSSSWSGDNVDALARAAEQAGTEVLARRRRSTRPSTIVAERRPAR